MSDPEIPPQVLRDNARYVELLKQIASGDIQCSSLSQWREKAMKMAMRALKGRT